MNALLYDHATVAPRALKMNPSSERSGAAINSSSTGAVFGPSCDGLDTVLRGHALPRLDVGDWLVFGRHGAYTFTGACPFNGMDPTPATFYVFSEQ
jgi:ornithine decarboxylase